MSPCPELRWVDMLSFVPSRVLMADVRGHCAVCPFVFHRQLPDSEVCLASDT